MISKFRSGKKNGFNGILFFFRYKNNQEVFKETVQKQIQQSHDQLYQTPENTDKHYITFEPYLPERHNSVRESMKMLGKEERCVTMGASWVSPGSLKALSRSSDANTNEEL